MSEIIEKTKVKKPRLKEVDILRAIAFILVVVQHTLGGFSNIKGLNYYEYFVMKFLYVLAKPAVPVFLALSAISLFYTYSDDLKVKEYYIKRLKFVILPYVIWSIVVMFQMGNEDRLANLAMNLIAGNGAYHLWYMGMIIRVYLYFPMVLWASKKIQKQAVAFRVIVFIGLFIIYCLASKYDKSIADKVGIFIFGKPSEVQQKIVNISPLFYFIYFVVGIYAAMNYEYAKSFILKYKASIIFIYSLLFVYAYLNELKVFTMVTSIYTLYSVFSIAVLYIASILLTSNDKVYKLTKFISDYSFASYMLHVVVITKVFEWLRTTFHLSDYLVLGLLTLGITSILTPILISLIGVIPYHKYIIGTKSSITARSKITRFLKL